MYLSQLLTAGTRWREVLYVLDLEDELTNTPQLDRESRPII